MANIGNQPNPSADLTFLSDVYDLDPSGPLAGQAHVTIPLRHPAPVGTAIIVATREDPSQPWDYLPATLSADRATASFDTTHFSLYGILGFNPQKLADQFQQQFLKTVSGGLTATVDKPTCDREQDARAGGYHVTSSNGSAVYWCFGLDGTGRRILKVTNNVRYPLQVLHPNMQTLANPRDLVSLASLSRLGSGNYAIIAPGVTATFNADLGPGGAEGIRTYMDGVGQSLYALQVGIESFLAIAGHLGVGVVKSAEAMQKILMVKGCADALDEGPGAWVAGCMSATALSAAFGGAALLFTPMAAIGSMGTFLRSEWHALQDSWTGHDQYRIDITRDGAALTVNDLLSAPVPAECGHPAGRLVDGELPVQDPMTTPGGVWLYTVADGPAYVPVFADLTGDDTRDAAAVTGCTAGGVSWPQTLVFYSPGPVLIGSVELPNINGEEHADLVSMKAQGRDLAITFTTYEGAGFGFRYFAGLVHWNGTAMELLDVRQTG